MTLADVHDSRLGEARIQGDKQGCFADRAYDSQAFARDAQTAASSTGSPGRSSMPAIRSRPGGKSTTPGRGACAQPLSALSRALVRYLGACAQRLPSAVHRRGDELEAGARADARDLGGRGSNPSAVPRYDSHPKTRQNRRQPSLLSQTMQSQRKSAPSAKLSIYVCSPRDRERVGSMGRGERDLCAQPMPRMKTGADFFVFFRVTH